MSKRYAVQVREPGPNGRYSDPGAVIATINRVLWQEAIGNFCPLFCTYKGKRCLVNSLEGDASDPFRREESYAQSFYIVP